MRIAKFSDVEREESSALQPCETNIFFPGREKLKSGRRVDGFVAGARFLIDQNRINHFFRYSR